MKRNLIFLNFILFYLFCLYTCVYRQEAYRIFDKYVYTDLVNLRDKSFSSTYSKNKSLREVVQLVMVLIVTKLWIQNH